MPKIWVPTNVLDINLRPGGDNSDLNSWNKVTLLCHCMQMFVCVLRERVRDTWDLAAHDYGNSDCDSARRICDFLPCQTCSSDWPEVGDLTIWSGLIPKIWLLALPNPGIFHSLLRNVRMREWRWWKCGHIFIGSYNIRRDGSALASHPLSRLPIL